jgi:hypothetical protein
MSDPNALPIAGWYPDPENEAGDRWWNGATWSDHRRPRNAAPGWAPEAASAAATPAVPTPAVPTPAVPAPAIPVPPAPAPARPDPYAGTPQVAPGYQAAPGYQPAFQPYAPAYAPNYAPAPTQMRNQLAFAGMLVSLIGLLFNWILFGAPGITGGIISIVGLRRANALIRSGVTAGNGKGMAIGGIVAGFTGALLFDLWFFSTWTTFQF